MQRFNMRKISFLPNTFLSAAVLCASAFCTHTANATVLYVDDFESGFGSWTNTSVGDNKSWTRDSNGTPSQGTGPYSGADGSQYYVYLETSSGAAYTNGDSAILLSPTLNSPNINLSFSYHMFGSDIGFLSVDVLTAGGWVNDVWNLSGQQQSSNGAAYTNATVDLGSYDLSQIRFRATALGGYRGDIAIDNVEIESIPTGPVAPSFSSTDLSKGPAREGDAYSTSIADDATDANGDAITFSKVSGPDWLSVASDGLMTGTPAAADVGTNSFVVAASDGNLSSTATVTIEVEDRYTPFLVTAVDFEQGLGDWTNVTNADNKDWTRKSNGTPSSGTGPIGGSDSLYYLYLETSSGSAYTSGDTAIFISPEISAPSLSLSFDYHMYGSDIGTLAVDVLAGGAWVDNVWTLSGQQQTSNAQNYESAVVNLAEYSASQIRFRATAIGGYRGDIAIDNIRVESVPAAAPAAPSFVSDVISAKDGRVNLTYSDTIADQASDTNGDELTFSKVSGPAWLTVGSSGQLIGLPGLDDVGDNSFVVMVSDGELSDTATLTIFVEEQMNPQVISFSDFETDLGDWMNIVSDDYDWIRQTGFTPTVETGPYNGADGSSYYLYVETSPGAANVNGDTVILESKPIIGGSDISLTFQYHLYGADIGRLAIDIFDGVAWIDDVFGISLPQQAASGSDFRSRTVDLSYWTVEKIRIRARAAGGDKGDIAIDSLQINGNGSIDNTPPPTPVKIAFVTSQGFTGDLGGLSGADAKCQTEANAAGLSGTFKAFLSDNRTSAASRLNHSSIPYETVIGTRIAADWADLTDRIIDNRLNVTAYGTTVSGFAWTGSDYDGTKATYIASDYPYYTPDLTCSDWSLGTSASRIVGGRGSVTSTTAWADWWQNDGSSCSSQLGLYCLEQ